MSHSLFSLHTTPIVIVLVWFPAPSLTGISRNSIHFLLLSGAHMKGSLSPVSLVLIHWWIFYKDSGAPPLWQKISQLAESEWKIIKNKQISNQISCFYSIFIIIFPIFCQIIQNLAFLAQIVQKYGSLIEKFPKISSAKNESRCRGPWQKIDFFVKYSPVCECRSV